MNTEFAAGSPTSPRTRRTAQRDAVVDALHRLRGLHPTAADVHELVRAEFPNMSLATVYRALVALVAQDRLATIPGEHGTRFDIDRTPHHHIVCIQCGSVADVCSDIVGDSAIRHLEECSGYQVAPRPVHFHGTCPRCADKPHAQPIA